MCDNGELIMAIENHPCLWDTGHKDYHNREIKDIAWEEVCSRVYEQWEGMTEDEKNKKYTETKKKWTNLRDCYRRDFLNRLKINSSKGPKKYIYADLLSFLAPVLRIKGSSGFEQNFSDEEDNSASEKEKCDNTVREFLKMDNDNHVDGMLLATSTKRKHKQTDTKDLPSRLMRLVAQPVDKQTPADDDDDIKFLLSFRSDLRSMNKRQKVDFKIGMLQLLKNVYGFKDCSRDGNSSGACNSEPQEWVYVEAQTS